MGHSLFSLEGVWLGLRGKKMDIERKTIFVCPFFTILTEKLDELIFHFRKEHGEAALRAYAEEQVVPKK